MPAAPASALTRLRAALADRLLPDTQRLVLFGLTLPVLTAALLTDLARQRRIPAMVMGAIEAGRLARYGEEYLSPEGPDLRAFPRPLSPEGRAEVVATLLDGPYAQRLYGVFGRPAIVSWDAAVEQAGSAGLYRRDEDAVRLGNGPRATLCAADVCTTLAHELVHAWQARAGTLLGRVWRAHGIPRPSRRVAGGRGSYAGTEVIEQQAEATASALSVLDLLDRQDLGDAAVARAVGRLDALSPGTIVMTRLLRAHPAMQDRPGAGRALPGLDLAPVPPPGGWPSLEMGSWLQRDYQLYAATSPGALGATMEQLGRVERRIRRGRG